MFETRGISGEEEEDVRGRKAAVEECAERQERAGEEEKVWEKFVNLTFFRVLLKPTNSGFRQVNNRQTLYDDVSDAEARDVDHDEEEAVGWE